MTPPVADPDGQAAAASAAEELYGLDPAEFTTRRDALAARIRKGGDAATAKVVKSLKRPSLPAWAVNSLARERPDELGRLLELGGQLRRAQARLSGDELRRLTRDRQELIAALAVETREMAAGRGHALTEAALREVEETLTAALVDPAAADAVTSGRLVRALDYAGIGPVELDGAVARSPSGEAPAAGAGVASAPAAGAGVASAPAAEPEVGPAQDEQRRSDAGFKEAEKRSRQAEAALKEAEERRRQAEGKVAAAAGEVDRLEKELDRARLRLDDLRGELEQASTGVRDAEARLSDARAAIEEISRPR